MKLTHTMLFACLAILGGFFGGLVARPTSVNAQVPPVKFDSQVLVPNEGLRFVTPDNRTVAFMGLQGGNAFLALLDSNGRPGATIRATADGGEVTVSSPDGKKVTRITAGASGSSLEAVVNNTTLLLQNRGSGASLMLPATNGSTVVELTSAASGGTVTLYGPSQKAALTVEGNATGGILQLRDSSGTVNASVNAAGTFSSMRAGRTVWQAPPAGG